MDFLYKKDQKDVLIKEMLLKDIYKHILLQLTLRERVHIQLELGGLEDFLDQQTLHVFRFAEEKDGMILISSKYSQDQIENNQKDG